MVFLIRVCGCARAGGGNFELHFAVLNPPNSRRDERSQESHLGRIVVFKNRKLFFLQFLFISYNFGFIFELWEILEKFSSMCVPEKVSVIGSVRSVV